MNFVLYVVEEVLFFFGVLEFEVFWIVEGE